jgi:hypothetical protein
MKYFMFMDSGMFLCDFSIPQLGASGFCPMSVLAASLEGP